MLDGLTDFYIFTFENLHDFFRLILPIISYIQQVVCRWLSWCYMLGSMLIAKNFLLYRSSLHIFEMLFDLRFKLY